MLLFKLLPLLPLLLMLLLMLPLLLGLLIQLLWLLQLLQLLRSMVTVWLVVVELAVKVTSGEEIDKSFEPTLNKSHDLWFISESSSLVTQSQPQVVHNHTTGINQNSSNNRHNHLDSSSSIKQQWQQLEL
jgi:hypothetical protein